ncbi:MAG: Gfo/Idh/MocA family oxidoreductase [Candidatus Omnitrophota bacterium]
MRVLVIGCGSIGERHIQNLRKLKIGEILISDIDKKRLLYVSRKYKISLIFNNFKDALEKKPDAAIISTPPNSHIPIGLAVVNSGVHAFIEKPLSDRLKGIDEFIKESKKTKLVIFIGYNLRFHPGLQLVRKILTKGTIGRILCARAEFGQNLTQWRPNQDYRRSYSAKKAMGGGIILESSHELDYLSWLIGDIKNINCFAKKVSTLEVDTEDTAQILLEFKSGVIAQVHLDFIRYDYSRNCELIGDKGTIIWDYSKSQVKVYIADKKKWKIFNVNFKPNNMYLEELRHFINCILKKQRPLISAEEGRKILRVALAAKRSAKTGKKVSL